ncbi:MAG: NAD(P)-dependent glycerol-3-phosphate dehydrogenase, partial [Rhodospirillaceae bacterium]|nr:NAD(P)-dependent glycerol-3-phosphate dehydrogenase [Rhodospirillaceae bacterium]
LWARDPAAAAAIRATGGSPRLPGIAIAPPVEATDDLAAALAGVDLILLAVPAQAVRALCERLRPLLARPVPAVICAKGIEAGSGLLMSEVLAEALPGLPTAVLSGPTFAAEVAAGKPTAVTLACADPRLGAALVARLGRPHFRPYLSSDPVGAQLGGAVKNVLAIACGIVEGRGLGDNARAALVTRGLAEMLRLGRAKGARPETLMGLCGLGDLVLTCTSRQSRNLSLGTALGEGRTLTEALAAGRGTVEGVATAPALVRLARGLGVEMPIAEAVAAILHGGASIDATIAALLARPYKAEDA